MGFQSLPYPANLCHYQQEHWCGGELLAQMALEPLASRSSRGERHDTSKRRRHTRLTGSRAGWPYRFLLITLLSSWGFAAYLSGTIPDNRVMGQASQRNEPVTYYCSPSCSAVHSSNCLRVTSPRSSRGAISGVSASTSSSCSRFSGRMSPGFCALVRASSMAFLTVNFHGEQLDALGRLCVCSCSEWMLESKMLPGMAPTSKLLDKRRPCTSS